MPRYAATGRVSEFKTMVKTFHSAGIEVILDVVHSHTAEGSHLGPTLSLRGVDNASCYRLAPDNPRYYADYMGCGDTLNMRYPRVLQPIMDSLRYLVLEMHVDGFRFDLASALARELQEVDRLGAFFDILRQDPVPSDEKLIAESWESGEGGYPVGNFPPGWTEWNDRYRDKLRAFWKGDGGPIGEFAQRFAGSSDLYERATRARSSGISARSIRTTDGRSIIACAPARWPTSSNASPETEPSSPTKRARCSAPAGWTRQDVRDLEGAFCCGTTTKRCFGMATTFLLEVSGDRAAHLCAFARCTASRAAVILAPRLYASLASGGNALPSARRRRATPPSA